MDLYLRGVVPAEMPSLVAGRVDQGPGDRGPLVRRGTPPLEIGAYDVYDDTRSQIYLGSLGE